MRTKLIAILSIVCATSFADIIPPVRWDVETGRLEPRPYSLSIRRGESLKIEPRFVSYSLPINLTNSTIEMRYSSAYDSETYYSAVGTVQSETGRVQISWNDSLNPTNSALVYEIRATSGTNVLARAYGPLNFLGGMVGVNTGLMARSSIDWSSVSQLNGTAVLSNQMGSGATWNGSQWTFAGGGSGTDSNAWHYGDNVTNATDSTKLPISATNGWEVGSHSSLVTNSDPRLSDSRAPLSHSQPLSTITNAGNLAYSNSLTAADVGAATTAQGALADTALQRYNTGAVTIVGTDYPPSLLSGSGLLLRWDNINVTGPISPAIGFAEYFADNVTNWLAYRSSLWGNRAGFARFIGPEYDNTSYLIYDEGNHLAGTHYLAPNGSGASLTGITASQVGALSTNGDTVYGPLYTTRTDGWAGNELITADAVRGLLASGKALYMTTNAFNASWSPTNTTTIGSYEPTAYSTRFSVGISSANQYIATMVDTNPIPAGTEMVGPATIVINIFTPSGSQTSLSVKPEIYYTYNLNATNLTLGDFDATAQAITVGVTNSYTWLVAFAQVVPTSTYYRVYRLKTTAKGNSTTTVSIGMGGSIDSFVLYQQGADTLGERGATNIVTGAANGYDSATRTLTSAGITNISVNNITGTVSGGIASVTITAGGGVSAPSTWDIDLTWGDLAQATTADSVGLVYGQLSGQSIYNASNTVRYASFCTALTNVTTATASAAFTVPLGYGGTGAVFYVKQSQATNSPLIFKLNDGVNTLSVTGQVTATDTETSIPFAWPVWATNAGSVVGIQAVVSGASTNVNNVRYWGVNRKVRLQK